MGKVGAHRRGCPHDVGRMSSTNQRVDYVCRIRAWPRTLSDFAFSGSPFNVSFNGVPVQLGMEGLLPCRPESGLAGHWLLCWCCGLRLEDTGTAPGCPPICTLDVVLARTSPVPIRNKAA